MFTKNVLVISANTGGAAETVVRAIAEVGFSPWVNVNEVFIAEGTRGLIGDVLPAMLVIGRKMQEGVYLEDQRLPRDKPYSVSRAYGCLSGEPPFTVRINPSIKPCDIHRAANEICALLAKNGVDDFETMRAENSVFQSKRMRRARDHQDAYVDALSTPYDTEEVWGCEMAGTRRD